MEAQREEDLDMGVKGGALGHQEPEGTSRARFVCSLEDLGPRFPHTPHHCTLFSHLPLYHFFLPPPPRPSLQMSTGRPCMKIRLGRR